MIDVKDLMVGALVYAPSGNVCKITTLYINNNEYWCNAENNLFKYGLTCKSITPISLTAEMLILNGFEFDGEGTFIYKTREITFQIYWSTITNMFYLPLGLDTINISSVHALQRALYICGVKDLDELADNFKVSKKHGKIIKEKHYGMGNDVR